MKNASKKWLTVAAVMTILAISSPAHAEEESPAPAEIVETIDAPTETVEIPVENTTGPEQATETPTDEAHIDQPTAAPIEDVATPPTLLVDHLAPETYAGLEDPNVKLVLVDISDQYVWAFENGTAVLESPMISGKANTKAETSRGIFKITFKKPGKYLRGPGYKSWVDYWMLFDTNRSIGLHDANWRSAEQYVPETYLTDGSRGCINLPCDFAPLLYDFVEIGTPVIVQD